MELVNVLVTTRTLEGGLGHLPEECLRQVITTGGSKIKLSEASALVRAECEGDFISKEKLDAMLAETEVVYGTRLPPNLIARAPKLKWIQVMSAGVDHYWDGKLGYPEFRNEFLQSSVIMTNASANPTGLAEHALAMMLMFVTRAPLCFQLKQQRQWTVVHSTNLGSKIVAIVGLGAIGGEVARLSKALGMGVMATRRSAKTGTRARYVDVMLPQEQLHQLLSESDFVVLTLPLTAETEGLIGEEELRTMKSTAYLINICRGKTVDEEALIRALDEHWIAGAGLETFATEPLPPDSRLWDFPNVIFYPHSGGGVEDYEMRITKMFCENLNRYLNGKKLLHVVDKKKGY